MPESQYILITVIKQISYRGWQSSCLEAAFFTEYPTCAIQRYW